MLSATSLYNELVLALTNKHFRVARNRAARLLVRLEDSSRTEPDKVRGTRLAETGEDAELDGFIRNINKYLA